MRSPPHRSPHIAILTALLLTMACHAVQPDITWEFVAAATRTADSDTSTDLYGTVFVKPLDTDDVVVDLHVQFGDDRLLLNVGYVKFLVPHTDIIVGRQLLAWGSGYNVNPTDIFNAKPLGAAFDPTYTRTGRDAILVTAYAGPLTVDLLYAPPYRFENRLDADTTIDERGDEDIGCRLKLSGRDCDLALSYARVECRTFDETVEPPDDVLGVSFKGSIPIVDWGVWAEAAQYVGQALWEAAIGLEYFWSDVTVNVEYIHNGFGADSKAAYDPTLFLRGRSLARDYLVPSVAWTIDEKKTLTLFAFWNLSDNSSVAGGVLDYFHNDMIEIILTPFVLSGAKDTEYGMEAEQSGDYGLRAAVRVAF